MYSKPEYVSEMYAGFAGNLTPLLLIFRDMNEHV